MAPAIPQSAGSRKRSRALGVTLPPDLQYEVLLRLPAGPVCRFRDVCRSWRAILSSRRFLAAHEAHWGRLLLAGAPYRSSSRTWHVDLAGTIARRTRAVDGIRELSTSGDLAFSVGADNRARVLDPATGGVTPLPHGLSPENTPRLGWRRDARFDAFAHAFGRVSSTAGEYKVLRLVRLSPGRRDEQLVEVLTLAGDSGAHGGEARWRGKRSPPFLVAGAGMDGMAVVGGVVHFLAVHVDQLPFAVDNGVYAEPGSIASFDLETEEWMPSLRGSLNSHQGEPQLMVQQDVTLPPLLTLTELKGFLVTVHHDRHQPSSMDLWFLIDSEEETWVKKYSIQVELCSRRREFYAQPLCVLGDRKIVLCVRPKGGLMEYDLQTGTCRDLDLGKYVAVSLYKGCLLSSGSADKK